MTIICQTCHSLMKMYDLSCYISKSQASLNHFQSINVILAIYYLHSGLLGGNGLLISCCNCCVKTAMKQSGHHHMQGMFCSLEQ